MNSYAHRWRLAVALKQPYPSPLETGAVDVGAGDVQQQRRESMALGFGFGAVLLALSWLGAPKTAPEGMGS